MTMKETFTSIIAGPLTYEEIHERCLDFIERRRLKNATIEAIYLAEDTMAYAVWVKWESGWIFKKPNYRSAAFGIREDDRQDNVLGYQADIESKTTYKCSRPWFGPRRIDIRTEFTRAIGSKTQDGTVIKGTRTVDEFGDPVTILHT